MCQRYILKRMELHAAPQAKHSVHIPWKNHKKPVFNRYKRNTANKRGGGELPVVLEELSDLVSGKDDVEQAFDQSELTKAIDTFLDSLSPKKRSIFISRYWYTDSISEIAVRHNMNDGAVSMILNRLRLKLHNYLLERGFEL